jgi:hypothetical protein
MITLSILLANVAAGSISLLTLILIIAALGGLVWGLSHIPMPAPFKTIITVVAVLVAVYLVLVYFGVWAELKSL